MNFNNNVSHVDGKNFWGPKVWSTIHIFSASYTPDQKQAFKDYIYNVLPKLLPCESCRSHLKENIKTIPLEPYLTNNHNVFLWSYLLHDLVNKQLGKTSPAYNQIKEVYFKGLGPDCTSCKL
jgi:hypothetical protein